MYNTLVTAVKLDPYNMDAYYFAQSAFTWEVGRVKEVNSVLEYGMKYRTWIGSCFFVGFNEAYFLKNYAKAANICKRPLNSRQQFVYSTGFTLFLRSRTKRSGVGLSRDND